MNNKTREAVVQNDYRKPGPGETIVLMVSALAIIAYLVTLVLVTLATCVWLLGPGGAHMDANYRALLLCIVAGTLGSTGMALVSVAERVAAGWEIYDGSKWPESNRKDRFSLRMLGQFAARPFLGSLVGFVTYVGVVGGYFLTVSAPAGASLRPAGMAFFAVLAGLFAKTMLEQLKEIFKALVGARKTAGAEAKNGQ